MKKIKYLLWFALGYVVTGITKVFGQFEEFKQYPISDPYPINVSTVGLPSPPTLIEQITRTSGRVVTIVAPIIGVWIFLRKAAKKQPPMSTIKKILLSIAIFLGIFTVSLFIFGLILWLIHNT